MLPVGTPLVPREPARNSFANSADTTLRPTISITFWATAPANGQARIDAENGFFTYLMIDVPNGSFSSLILNLDATIYGTVDFTATTNTGVEVFNNIAIGGNGNNFFTFTTEHGQRFLSIAYQADGALEFDDAAQFRIGGAQLTTTVPDAASTLSLLGLVFAGIAVARRRLSGS